LAVPLVRSWLRLNREAELPTIAPDHRAPGDARMMVGIAQREPDSPFRDGVIA